MDLKQIEKKPKQRKVNKESRPQIAYNYVDKQIIKLLDNLIQKYKNSKSIYQETSNNLFNSKEDDNVPVFEYITGHKQGLIEGLLKAKYLITEKYLHPFERKKAPHLTELTKNENKSEKFHVIEDDNWLDLIDFSSCF